MFSNNNTRRLLGAAFVAVVAITLTACGKQPPNCTSSDIGKTIKGIVTNDLVSFLKSEDKLAGSSRVIAEKYLEALKLNFGTAVEQAHDEKTKLRACKGDYTLSTPTGEEWGAKNTEWTAQITSDGKDYVVNLPRAIVMGMYVRLLDDLGTYLTKEKKLSGSWDGKFRCPKIGNTENSPAATYVESDLKLTIEGRDVKGKLLTQTGNTNIFTGSVNLLTDEISLDVEVFNPEGVRLASYGKYLATLNAGKVQMKLNTCTMDLKQS
jgi:hypothetical protein